jgi:hypothetical protein
MNPTILPGSGRYNAPGAPPTGGYPVAPHQPTGMYGAPGGGGGGVPPRDDKRKVAIAAGAGAAVVLIAALIFATATGILGAKKPTTPTSGVLTAPPAAPPQAPVLTAPPAQVPQAPVLTKPVAQSVPMPADVIDYLRWLKQFEAGRHQLEAKSLSEWMLVTQELVKVGLTGPSDWNLLGGDPEQPKENAKPAFDMQSLNAVIQDWNQAAAIFQNKTPPDPCATLAGYYNQGLTQSVSTMTSLLNGAAGALKSIQDSGGEKTSDASQMLTRLVTEYKTKSSSGQIDSAFTSSNQSLDALRAMYTDIPPDIDKGQFQIEASQGGGMNMPGLSVPGLGL